VKNSINLSILIPCYNWDVLNLINTLHSLCNKQLEINEFEIICIEDASEICYSNEQLSQIENVVYEKLKVNIGRSSIRNLMAKKAQYEWLLFIDADSKITHSNFINNYIKCVLENQDNNFLDSEHNIYYGITTYSNSCPKNDRILHWKYGTQIESKRKKNIFSSHHFLIKKELFDINKNHQIKFDENISTYGYEDLLFVINNNLKAIYINNPLCHIGLKKNNKFIKDTESALDNLINYSKFTHKYSEKIKIIQIAKTISMFYLDYFIILIFKLLKNSIINNLNSKNPSICLFQFYKLGYFLKKRHSSY